MIEISAVVAFDYVLRKLKILIHDDLIVVRMIVLLVVPKNKEIEKCAYI